MPSLPESPETSNFFKVLQDSVRIMHYLPKFSSGKSRKNLERNAFRLN